ncbi:MAG: hypothetical protein K2G37_03505 [Clostridia bacterium]|nr:hypothetical protein [Clostridia bacterium]MDE7328243.1 hypothetical protein [Clostridia bacterium]
MKNKKIVVCLVIAVMVLGFVLTALVGCKNYKEVSVKEMMDFLVKAVENTAKDNRLNNMELATSISLDTTYGSSKKSYTIDLAAQLALKTDDDNKNAASLVIKDGDGKNVFSAFYDEKNIGASVYLQIGESRFAVPAVLVKEVLKKNNASVSNDESDAITETIVDGIDGLTSTLQLIGGGDGMGIIKTLVSKDGKSYRIEISLEEIFNGDTWKQILQYAEGIQEVINDMGIALDINNIGNILPELVLGLNVNVTSKKAEEAKISGITADLSCPKKTVEVKRTDGGSLLTLKIAEDFTANVGVQFFFNQGKVQTATGFTQANTTVLGGAINFTASGTLTLENEVKGEIKAGPVTLNLNIPADTYKLLIEADINPAALVTKDFTNIHSTQHAIDVAIDALNDAVNYLNLQITTSEGDDFLQIKLIQTNSGLALAGNLTAVLPSINNMIKDGYAITDILTLLSSIGVNIPDNLDTGYAYADPAKGWKGGYVIAPGFVDEDENGSPDKDKNGNYVCAEGYVLVFGVPCPIETAPGYVLSGDKYVVDTANGYVDANNDGTPDLDKDGNYVCAEGYALYKGLPTLKADIPTTDDKEEDKTSLTVADVLKNLAVVIDGSISATLKNIAINKNLSLEANLGVNSTEINVNATLSGLNKMLEGLPESLGVKVNIKLSDFHYGTANRS